MCIRDRYSVGRELALWEKAWTLRNALFGLSTLAMLTALLGLPCLYRASQYKMLELEHATYAGIGRPLVMRFLLLLAGETILLGVLVPVSYTHLDVYKRQAICSPPSCTAASAVR